MKQDDLKLVLDALKWCHGGEPCGTAEAIAVVEKALAQEQEPVADDFFKMIADRNPKPFPPPQRTWVGLTDEDKSDLWEISRAALPRYATYVILIEAKLKEKNT